MRLERKSSRRIIRTAVTCGAVVSVLSLTGCSGTNAFLQLLLKGRQVYSNLDESKKDEKNESGTLPTETAANASVSGPSVSESTASAAPSDSSAAASTAGSDWAEGDANVSSLLINDKDDRGFQVTLLAGDKDKNVSNVRFAVWTEAGGQDDLVWYPAEMGGGNPSCYVPFSEHGGESGTYNVHAYYQNEKGEECFLYNHFWKEEVMTETSQSPETIPSDGTNWAEGDANVSSLLINGKDDNGFQVILLPGDKDKNLRNVRFAVWTEAGGQDDLLWYQSEIDGENATCYVPFSEHGGEGGTYNVHAYYQNEKGEDCILYGSFWREAE